MRGWVYILSNDSLSGLVKVGYTSKDPEGRAKELSGNTGVPTPFVVEYEVLIEDAHRCEQEIHKYLSEKRVNDRREFFRCSVNEAIEAVKVITGDSVQFERRNQPEEPELVPTVCYDLIGLIRYLIEDGELTNHEVYHLCEWLNSHPESCDIWPGTELVQPLSDVYSDDVLSPEELAQISVLLLKIDKEYRGVGIPPVLDFQKIDKEEAETGIPPVLDSLSQASSVLDASSQRPERKIAQTRGGFFGGLLQKMEQVKLDRAWRNRVEKFEEEERKKKRQDYIDDIIRRIELGENISNDPVGVIIRKNEIICWTEKALLIEEVMKGPRGHRYPDKVSVDRGDFIITTERFIFKGVVKTFDTKIDRVLSVDIAVDGFSYTIQNRTKNKMFEFPNGNGDIICAVLNHIGAS